MDRSFPTPTPPRLEVQMPSGRVTIRAEASDRTDVHVEDDGHDDRWDVDLHPGRAGDGDVIVVRRHNRSGRGSEPEVEITCPLGTSVDAQFASADLSARGVLGAVRVKTASGDVHMERAEGPLAVNTVSGDVTVGHASRTVDVHTVSGDQRIDELGPGSATFNTVSGDVAVGVVGGIDVWLDLQSVAGDTASDLPPTAGPEHEPAGPMLELRMHSVSGDLRVSRAT